MGAISVRWQICERDTNTRVRKWEKSADSSAIDMAEWTSNETSALINVWASPEFQNDLYGVVWNKAVYEKVGRYKKL